MSKSKYNFAFKLPSLLEDPTQEYRDLFFHILQTKYPQLTICGLEEYDEYYVEEHESINYVRPESVIEVSNERNYNVDWYGTTLDALMNGVETDLNLRYDWKEILAKLDAFAYVNNPIVYRMTKPQREAEPTYVVKSMVVDQVKNGTSVEVPGFPKIDVMEAFVKIGTKIYPRVISVKQHKKYASQKEYMMVYNKLKDMNVLVIR